MVTPAIPTNFATAWEEIAREHPERDCQVQGDAHVSWGEVNTRANAIATTLLEAGLVRQDKVALYLYNSPEYLEAAWASFKAGLVPVNTNYRYRGDELIYLWTNAEVRVVVFHARFTSTIEEIRDALPDITLWLCVDDGSGRHPEWADSYDQAARSPSSRDVFAPWGRDDDDIYLLYTGGTTGLPKGVMCDRPTFFDTSTR